MTIQQISGRSVLFLFLASVVGCDQRVLVGTMNQGVGGAMIDVAPPVSGVGGEIFDSPGLGGAGGTVAGGGAPGSGAGGSGGAGGTPVAIGGCARISTVPGQVNLCGRTTGIAFSPDGLLLATATQTRRPNIHIWSLPDGTHVRDIDGVGQGAYSVAFSPDGATLGAVGEDSGTGGGGNIAALFNVATGSILRALPVNSGFYSDSVAFSPDGTLVATAGFMGAIEVWRVADAALVTSIPYGTSVHNVHFSPAGSQIIVGGVDERATVWNIPAGTLAMTLPGIAGEMADAAFSPDGQQIATTSNTGNDIKIWDASGILLQTLSGHTAFVSHVVWLGADRVITNDWSGMVRSWSRSSTGAFGPSGTWSTGAQSLGIAVSPDKTRIVAGGGNGSNEGFVFLAP